MRANYFYTTKLTYCFDKTKYYLLFLVNIAKLVYSTYNTLLQTFPLYHCPPTCLTSIAKHVGAQSIASRRQQANKYTNLISQPLIELTHRVFALLD